MTEWILLGPFLTRAEAAEKAGLAADDLPFRPDLIRIDGRSLPEVYCRFQFDCAGVRRDIGTVVLAMRSTCDDLTMADWLVRGNVALHGEAPLDHLNRTHSSTVVLAALATHPPAPEPAAVAPAQRDEITTARSRIALRHHAAPRRPRYGHPAPIH